MTIGVPARAASPAAATSVALPPKQAPSEKLPAVGVGAAGFLEDSTTAIIAAMKPGSRNPHE